jgi:hypothetical protein
MPQFNAVRGDPLDNRDAQIAKISEHVVFLAALTRALSDRVSILEGIESVPIDRALLMTVKIAAHRSGLSESGVRKLIRENRVGHAWIGGRVFLTELPSRRREPRRSVSADQPMVT